MSDSSPNEAATPPLAKRLVLGAVVLVLAATVLLWAHFGTEVFIQTALSGLALCF